MLNEQELAAFLLLLSKFSGANNLSAMACANVLGVSTATMTRWFRIMRGDAGAGGVYRWTANAARQKIEKLNEINEQRGTYRAIAGQKTGERVALLQSALEGRLVW